MAFGKLYTYPVNPRSTAILAIAKANNLELETVEVDTTKPSPEFLKHNPLAKVPTFVGSDGYVLTECVAIAIYITSQNEKTTLLGKTKQDYASILKWMSFFNTEVLPKMGAWYRPLLGKDPYNKENVEDASKAALKAISVVEEHLLHHTYLVGERITLADLFAVAIIARGFEFFFDKKWRADYPNTTRWYETVYNQPIYSAVAAKFELLDTPKLTNVAPKEAEEEDAPAEPKAKHPLQLLPRATFPLDEWKRQYSNTDTPEALKWFWDNIKWDEYSLWKVVYKYNEELTMTFMSNNLIGGFNNRLEGSRKYLFGAASVYGETNDSVISGAFIIRGEDYEPVFNVAPDYESYEFTKLDPTKPEDKEYVESMWSWDRPITHNGKTYPHTDGKVFK